MPEFVIYLLAVAVFMLILALLHFLITNPKPESSMLTVSKTPIPFKIYYNKQLNCAVISFQKNEFTVRNLYCQVPVVSCYGKEHPTFYLRGTANKIKVDGNEMCTIQ